MYFKKNPLGIKNKNFESNWAQKPKKATILAISLFIAGSFLLPEKYVLASEITSENLLKLTNEERLKNNLKPLNKSIILKKAAVNKAQDLLKGQYFSHTSPKGKNFIEWIKEAGYDYLYAGENLAMDFISAEGVVNAWMKSKSHRDNILSPYYSEIAIAIKSGNYQKRPTIMVTQLFGRPKQNNNTIYAKNELTQSKFNGIINNNHQNKTEKIVLNIPSLLDYNHIDSIYLNDKTFLKTKPVIAGATTKSNVFKSLTYNSFLFVYLISIFLISYIFVTIINRLYYARALRRIFLDHNLQNLA